jgi:hypothetical protein
MPHNYPAYIHVLRVSGVFHNRRMFAAAVSWSCLFVCLLLSGQRDRERDRSKGPYL